MGTLRYTLVSDSSSDQALLPILTWLLEQYVPQWDIQPVWFDPRLLPTPPAGLADRIAKGVDLYPCELLFVHRDAEKQPRELRVREIHHALGKLTSQPAVCVVPVRMQEAWLLIDEAAVRRASGNPNGRQKLDFPRLHELEDMPDPKDVLHRLLRDASELQGRHRKRFRANARAHDVARFIGDWTPLRHLSAFAALEQELRDVIAANGWNGPIV